MVLLQENSTNVFLLCRFHPVGSHFGAVLDMVCDRFCTCSLYLCLANIYPQYKFFIILMLILEITSHWIQMYAYAFLSLLM